MAKDRNTFAKRQREVEKKRKRDEKRQRRASKKSSTEEAGDSGTSPSAVPPAERAVLKVFRHYLMTPGKMLCFSSADLANFDAPLDQLTRKGMLVADQHQGGFSLTESGFAAMMSDDERPVDFLRKKAT